MEIKTDIQSLPKSPLAKWIYYIYNTMMFVNAFITIVLTFIDDDWKETHHFDFVTKILQWSLGLLIFLWVVIFKIIPLARKKHLALKINHSPHKIQSKLDKLAKKKQAIEKQQIEILKKVKEQHAPTTKEK